MTYSASSETDRRLAPRLRTSFVAEFASGSVLVPVMVQDMSVKGCGVEIQGGDADIPDKLGMGGVLHLPPSGHGSPATLLPFVLRNVRSEGQRVVYGMEFRSLDQHQTRKLLSVMEAMAQEAAEGRP